MQLQKLITANQKTLADAETVLSGITDAAYIAITDPFTAPLGKHMRHITDHYVQLFDGLEGRSSIDYDGRERDESIETNRHAMIEMLQKISHQLTKLVETADGSVNVVQSIDENQESPVVLSTLNRELLFLQSHATHHFVIISAILKMQGVLVPEEFGIAPSTLKYEHQQCAH